MYRKPKPMEIRNMSPDRAQKVAEALTTATAAAASIGALILAGLLYRLAWPPVIILGLGFVAALAAGVLIGLALADGPRRRRDKRGYALGYTVGYRKAREDLANETAEEAAQRSAEMREIVEQLYNGAS